MYSIKMGTCTPSIIHGKRRQNVQEKPSTDSTAYGLSLTTFSHEFIRVEIVAKSART